MFNIEEATIIEIQKQMENGRLTYLEIEGSNIFMVLTAENNIKSSNNLDIKL